MKEYIERKALLQELAELYDNIDPRWQRGRDARLGLTMAKKVIETQPAADVQEVVRCKDCKHYELRDGAFYCTELLRRMNSDDFCNYGIQKIRSEENETD